MKRLLVIILVLVGGLAFGQYDEEEGVTQEERDAKAKYDILSVKSWELYERFSGGDYGVRDELYAAQYATIDALDAYAEIRDARRAADPNYESDEEWAARIARETQEWAEGILSGFEGFEEWLETLTPEEVAEFNASLSGGN